MLDSVLRLAYLRFTFVIICTFGTKLSDATQKNYSYSFYVWPVESCPMSKSDWQAASKRTGCNDTHVYHCAPDKFHSSLVEFCYYKTPNLVERGNCLELAADGILNNVNCYDFIKGCPDEAYISNEIFMYPVCLSLAFNCFTSDVKCLQKKFKEQKAAIRQSDRSQTDFEGQVIAFYVLLPLLLSLLICLCVSLYFLTKYKREVKKIKKSSAIEENVPLATAPVQNEKATDDEEESWLRLCFPKS